MQECTQSYVRRPYGVGLLVAGFDVSFSTDVYKEANERLRKLALMYTKPLHQETITNSAPWRSGRVPSRRERIWKSILRAFRVVRDYYF